MNALRTIWRVLRRTFFTFIEINGEQRAASFAFYAFFALFPLILLAVSIGAILLHNPRGVSEAVTGYLGAFIPLNPADSEAVFQVIDGIVQARGKLGLVAAAGLIWSSTNLFYALVHGVNRAWHTEELTWWKVPLKNLLMLSLLTTALLLGVLVPAVLSAVEKFTRLDFAFLPVIYTVVRLMLPSLILFFAIAMLYKVSPRRSLSFANVWFPALVVAVLLKILQRVLLFYSYNIWNVNAIYGAVGVLAILLLWVYFCGIIILFGACLGAAIDAEFRQEAPAD